MKDSDIFIKNNLTDFEKLLFAESYIKELKAEISNLNVENGKLSSYIQELEYDLKNKKPEVNKLRSYKKELKEIKEQRRKYKIRADRFENLYFMGKEVAKIRRTEI